MFSHPEVAHGLTNEGIPQVNLDQLNPRVMMEVDYVATPLPSHAGQILTVERGGVLNWITFAMKLTRGKLLKGVDWNKWQCSVWRQLDQYEAQGMFGTPTRVEDEAAVF